MVCLPFHATISTSLITSQRMKAIGVIHEVVMERNST